MVKAQQIIIPVLITIHQASDNTIIHQREDSFTIDKTDEVMAFLQAAATRSGKPAADVLRQLSLNAVQDKLEKDAKLQKIINGFENTIKSKVRIAVTIDGKIIW
jgi:hypothetical protein